MPRELWAKLHVELLDDGKLYSRPDADFRLWVCLILLAKMTTEDGVLHGHNADSLRKRFNLRCSTIKVGQALEHFAIKQMLQINPDGSIRIVNFKKRQAVMDKQERNAARQRKWYADHNGPNADPNAQPNANLTTEEKRVREEEKRSPLGPPSGGAIRLRRSFREKPVPPEPQPKWKLAGCASPQEYEIIHAQALADAKEELK